MEQTILSHLIENEEYGRKVVAFLKEEYFHDQADRQLFALIDSHVKKYNSFPTKEILYIDLQNSNNLNEQQYNDIKNKISSLTIDPTTDIKWLFDKTEQFCQDKAVYNAIRQSIKIIDDDSQLTKAAIPKILQDALQVSFDTNIGHNFLDDADDRYDTYHTKEKRIDFNLEYLNKITQGGLPPKTLNCWIGSTGTGKSLVMCHMAAYNLMCNRNVLYITLEMAEERIAQRIDANLLDVTVSDIMHMSKVDYLKKMSKLKETTKGRLIIKEYPTASAGSAHFRHLLNELNIKKNFMPDIIYIDYLNLCTSSRIKPGSQANTYTYVKSIAEELRGLAVEFNLPIVTATQSNRSAMNASDMGLENTSDSIGLPMTVDFMMALISTEELEELGQLMFKQLKNRYGDPSLYKRFVVGVDKSKMRLYDVDSSQQEDIMDGPVMDSGHFMEEETERGKKVFDRSKFRGFN
jgi:replicative DNA helicase